MSDDLTGPPRPVAEALVELVEALDRIGARYAVVGAVAMAAHGVRRFTEDIDVLVARDDLERVLPAVPRMREVGRQPARGPAFQIKLRRPAGRSRGHVDIDLMVPVDPVETWALASALRARLAGKKVDVACAEAIVLLKLRAYLGGPRTREGLKHLSDAMALLESAHIDTMSLRRMVAGDRRLSAAFERALAAPRSRGRVPAVRRQPARRTTRRRSPRR